MPRRPHCSAIPIVQHSQSVQQGYMEPVDYHSLKRPCSTNQRAKR